MTDQDSEPPLTRMDFTPSELRSVITAYEHFASAAPLDREAQFIYDTFKACLRRIERRERERAGVG